MSNHKCYGKQRNHQGQPPSPWSGLWTGEHVDVDNGYNRLVELAEGLMRKFPEMSEDYAMEKAAEMCDRRDELL